MEYWLTVLKKPTGNNAVDCICSNNRQDPKIVFSNTLKNVEWKTAKLAKRGPKEEISELKQETGKDILVGSPSLIAAVMNLNLVDEFQLCLHPIILGSGSTPLIKEINNRINLKLLKTKTFGSGAITLYYEPEKMK